VQWVLRVVALTVQRRDALSWSEVLQKAPFGFAASEQAEFLAHAARLERVAQPALPVVALTVQRRDALSWSKVLRKVRFGRAVSEPPAYPAQAARRELAVRQAVHRELAVRQAPVAHVPSVAWRAGPVSSEAARPLAASDASPEAERAEAALPAASGAVAGLRLVGAPLAVLEPAAVPQWEVPGAVEVQHGALQARPSEVDLSALPSGAAFHVPSHARVRLAPVRAEQKASAHTMPRVRTASRSGPS
jgi:hypothetical protein